MTIKLDKTAMVRGLANRQRLVPHIERAIGETEWHYSIDVGPKPGDDAWHPSGDCTPSLHDLYCKAAGVGEDRPFGVGLRKTFQVGHWWHGYLQNIVEERLGFCGPAHIERRGIMGWGPIERKNSFAHIESSLLWEPWHWATGSADVCPCSIPGQPPCLVDFKTAKSSDFRGNGAPAWCVDKWECQANIYMDWFDVEDAIFVMILKDSPHDMREVYFKRNQDLIDAIYTKWKLVSACVDEGVMPPEDEPFDLPLQGPTNG